MRPKDLCIALLFVLCVSVAVSLNAQVNQSATGQSTSAPPEETKLGPYIAAGSIEAGYRFVDVSGAQYPCALNPGATTPGTFPVLTTCNYTGTWTTFENLSQGARVFDQSLSLRSVGQAGVLFDNLFVSSFGWGGDPQNVARLRVSKSKIYDLAVLFRRDYQSFDFNLIANPLNNPITNPNFAIFNSPHSYDTVRRMTDFNLTLAPRSPLSVRVGYNRLRFEGLSGYTFHMPRGTDINPPRDWNVTGDNFRAGVDLKFIPRTTFSLDGFVDWFRNDTISTTPYLFWNVAGFPASFGTSWNTPAAQPCGAAVFGTPACNLDFSYFQQDRVRTTLPTTAASVESHYWRRLDLSARFTYTWGDLDSRFLQNWNGWVGGGRLTAEQIQNNPVRNHRISSSGDLGFTFHLTDHIRFTNTFRYVNHRMPLSGVNIDTTQAGLNAITPVGAPVTAASGIVRGLFYNTRMDEPVLDFDLGRHAGVNIGYRFTKRHITQRGEAFDVDATTGERPSPIEPGEGGFDSWRIPEHTALGGVWFAPSDKFRVNLDAEASSAGVTYNTADVGAPVSTFSGITTFTRITPRHQQQYRGRVIGQPMRHVSVGGNVNIIEQRNSLSDILYRMHNRNYSFNADINPNERVLLDLAYNYQDYFQNDLVCYVYGTAGAISPGTFAGISTPLPCPQSGGLPATTSYFGAIGNYSNQTHFGSAMIRVKPVKRVTATVGYSIISTDGGFLNTNALQPFGPVQYNYHRPLAALEIEMAAGLALKGSYNYYDYNEKAGSRADVLFSGGPTAPRDFHTNTGSISLRYSF